MEYVVSLLIGYVLGCLNLAWVIGKVKKIDMQKSGSGNLGASNTVLHLGKRAGLAVAVHDILKAVLAVALVRPLFPGSVYAPYIAGAAAVLGHIFPFWLNFKAGKGFAPFIGFITSVTSWKFVLIMLAVCLAAILITDYIVSATFTSIAALPAYVFATTRNVVVVSLILAVSTVIFVKHIENIRRIRSREESRVRAALAKKHDRL